MSAPDPTAGERACRYPCDCGQFPDEHCACMDGHAPAAPETDVGGFSSLGQDERERVVDAYRRTAAEGYAVLFACVGQIVAERVRVVEGERDAALAEAAEMSGWIEEHALVTTLARIAEWQEATGAELPAMARAAMTAYAARAESAEAAHEALRKGIWALGESIHGDEGVEHVEGCEGEPTCFACILADLRALLAGGAS